LEDDLTDSISREWLERLAESGYRLTAPRRAIVEALARSTRALGPIELYDQIRRETPGLGLVTVYRTLEKLEELGLVQRVHQPGGCHQYLRMPSGHEHLLLCTGCGQAAYFAGDELDGLFGSVARATGFSVESHWLQLFGRCPTCAGTERADG
jgi:Fe2+ or Zn2+ uptake regulation protein